MTMARGRKGIVVDVGPRTKLSSTVTKPPPPPYGPEVTQAMLEIAKRLPPELLVNALCGSESNDAVMKELLKLATREPRLPPPLGGKFQFCHIPLI